jgi:hypothetical protein
MRIALILLAALSFSTTLTADSFDGTWKLNLAKSKIQCSDVASRTMTITSTAPNNQSVVSDIVSKSGVRQERRRNHVFDGKEHQVPGEPGVTQTAQRIDASTAKVTYKRNGKVDAEATVVVTANTLTDHQVSDRCEETLVFERQ